MIPGPELDHAIATKVMGWRWENEKCWYFDEHNDAHYGFESDYGYYSGIQGFYPFSREIGAAWKVVDKLNKCSWHVQKHPSVPEWEASVGVDGGKERFDYHIGKGETAAHAICMAALQAIE